MAGVLNPFERRLSRFLREPPSVRGAARAIVATTVTVVLGAGMLMRLVDHSEYPNVWVGMWWALQTVTTVGYGDVTPHRLGGRLVASGVMLEGIAFIAIITSAITSTFIARASASYQARQHEDDLSERDQLAARFDDLNRRLDGLEALLRERGS